MLKLIMTLTFAAAAAPVFSDEIIALPKGDLPWSTTPEGAEFAALDGDRFAEPYMAMVRLPAGLASPPHVKTANMFGVVMEGTFMHTASTGNAEPGKHLGPGSYYFVPAGLPHVSACVSDVPCVAFLYQDGAFDFNIVQN
jgi:hypothetical protein